MSSLLNFRIIQFIMSFQKRFIIGIILALFAFGSVAAVTINNKESRKIFSDILTEILMKITQFQQANPEDKVYAQFDKPLYKPGETVWFAVYVRNGEDFKMSAQSDIVNIEILNPKGAVEKTLKLIAKDGVAQGDFPISEEAAGGLYKFRISTNWMKNDPNPAIFEKEINVQAVVLPRLKMALDFPKDAYGAGANVSATLALNTNENKPLANFSFSYVVNLDGGQFIAEKGTTDASGNALIKFSLPKELKTNDGLLNVMIEYQGQTEAISRSVPITLNDIKMDFFPEGGDMVAGLPCRVAFRALNDMGKPADVEGYITDNQGNTVAEFSSYHKGMGNFSLTPKEGQVYMAHLAQPAGGKLNFELPEALPKGYVLKVDKVDANNVYLNVGSTQAEKLSIVANVRGKNYFAQNLDAKLGENILTIPTKNLPIGVAQITLFDSKGIERCERLAFVNQDKQLKIDISTDKEKYLPREKVTMTIKVKDERGMPMPANLSLSVVNDQLLSFADDKSANILSWLLIESDIKGKVDEPNFYFDTKPEPMGKNRIVALDNLLMTEGWRRYTWKEIMSPNPRITSYNAEKAEIGGIIMNGYQGGGVKDVKVQISGTNFAAITDEHGRFNLKGHVLDAPATLIITHKDMQGQNIYVPAYGASYVGYVYTNMPQAVPATTGAVDVMEHRPERIQNKMVATRVEMKNIPNKAEKPSKRANKAEAAIPMVAPVPAPLPPAPPAEPNAPKPVENKPVVVAMKQNVQDGRMLGKKIPVADQPRLAQGEAALERDEEDDFQDAGAFMPAQQVANVAYYRAKEFPSPTYTAAEQPQASAMVRSDFRSTLYWNGAITTDRTGKAVVSFYTSDEITSFRAIVEGISQDGMLGRSEKNFFSQLPMSLSAKLPVEVVTEDILNIPFTFVNNTEKTLLAKYEIEVPNGLEGKFVANGNNNTISLAPKEAKTQYFAFTVKNWAWKKDSLHPKKFIKARLSAWNYMDEIEQEIKIVPKGFPVKMAGSGSEAEKEFTFEINKPVEQSIDMNFIAYPSTVSEILSGLEGMLQEPSGCFEQTSSSTYPNILVLNYLEETGQAKPEVVQRAKDLIGRGYARLAGYESKSGGFEWFGGDPAHEGLTAYGLMEFMDMKKVWNGVDEKMINRTLEWLMDRKDEKGGFQRNPRALHEFGLADQETMNAYIVWALSESKQKNVEKELKTSYDMALKTKNPYQLGLMANAMANYGKAKEAETALSELIKIQTKEGVWQNNDKDRSAPGSGGQGLAIETASLALEAMMKAQNPDMGNIRKIAEFIRKSRNSYGSFGNTNSTVLALRALIKYASFSKRTDEDGKIEIYADGKKIATGSYKKGDQNPVIISGLEKYLGEGTHTIKVKYVGVKNPLPYTVSVNYYTSLPNSDKECVVALATKLATNKAKVGETVRLSATLTNTKSEGQPMTMAIIGLPAGLSPQPWQLKEMKEKNQFDFYEVKGNSLVLYYRQMKPSESRSLNFDLKADIAGTYEAPASSAYLYYTNEFRQWTALEMITIVE